MLIEQAFFQQVLILIIQSSMKLFVISHLTTGTQKNSCLWFYAPKKTLDIRVNKLGHEFSACFIEVMKMNPFGGLQRDLQLRLMSKALCKV